MSPRRLIKILVPVLLFISTFLPVYVPHGQTDAVNLYGLLGEMPFTAVVPIIFLASIIFAFAKVKRSSLYSALLAVFGIILSFVVNGQTDTSAATPEPYTSMLIILFVLITPAAYIWLLVSGIKRSRHKEEKKGLKTTHLLSMSPRRLSVLMAASFGLYSVYWFYQNWKAIQLKDGSRIRPFWRMFFSFIWAYPMFKRIFADAKKQGYKARYSPQVLAGTYIFAWAAPTVLSFFVHSLWSLVISVGAITLYILALVPTQQAVNFSNSRSSSPVTLKRRVTKGELLLVVVGIILMIFSIFIVLHPKWGKVDHAKLQGLQSKSLTLRAEYEQCSGALNKRLPSVDANDQKAVDAYNVDYDKCDAVRIKQNQAADEYQRYLIWPF